MDEIKDGMACPGCKRITSYCGEPCEDCTHIENQKAMAAFPLKHFIDKFSAIGDDKWCVNFNVDLEGRKCAMGHCGVISDGDVLTVESRALASYGRIRCANIQKVNDGLDARYKQETPKARILALLEAV